MEFREITGARPLLATLLWSLAVACGGVGPQRPVNLVLISIDSLRADRLGCYGAERDTSPATDRLASEGARVAAAMAPTSWTLPSHVTLLTGLSIPVHRVEFADRRIDPARRLLAEHLLSQGYATAAFVSAPLLHRAYGFDRGFSVYANFGAGREPAFPPSVESHLDSHRDETAPEVIDAALAWLAERDADAAGPFFLFVHLWDVHYDYVPPGPFDRLFDPDYAGALDVRGYAHNEGISADLAPRDLKYLRALYDGEIRWLDTNLERLYEALRARDDSGRTLISLVSDHGEEFFEHGRKGHQKTLFEESVRVPWILWYPAAIPPGTTIGGVASLEDVGPTLLGLLGAPPLPEATGRDLSERIRKGKSATVPVLLNGQPLAALRGPGWKVILNRQKGTAMFYDLAADPGELHPRPAARVAPAALRELRRRMVEAERLARSLPWQGGGAVELDPNTREKLRELGYLH